MGFGTMALQNAPGITRLAFSCALLSLALARGADTAREMPPENDPDLPQVVKSDSFDAIISSSPFTRTLGISDSLILTGVAHIERDVFATLFDTHTMESHVVSKKANAQGWQLVGVGGDAADLKTLSARIQVGGGQVITVRYQKPPAKIPRILSRGGSGSSGGGNSTPLTPAQVEEAQKAAVNYKKGFTSDGYPKAPPAEMVEKLSRLSVSQREDINRQMIGLRNQGLGMEERRKVYEDAVERATRGR